MPPSTAMASSGWTRSAIREALRRLPSEGGPKGFLVFEDDANDAYGVALGLAPSPIVSEADFIHLGLTNPEAEKPPQVELSEWLARDRASAATRTVHPSWIGQHSQRPCPRTGAKYTIEPHNERKQSRWN